MPFTLSKLIRPNILNLKPYTSARDEYKGSQGVFLDANENSFGSVSDGLHNRYPDPLQWQLKYALAAIKKTNAENIFIGNGSDEPIDILYRSLCRPNIDNVIITPPTYGMYEVSANINDIQVQKINLTEQFQLKPNEILAAVNMCTKLIFLCSPNNPTGNCLNKDDMLQIVRNFEGIVIVDEAYIDYSPDQSVLPELANYPNLVVMQTFSKAWGMANLRIGIAFASNEIISLMNQIKPPYNVNGLSQSLALEAIKNLRNKDLFVQKIINQRGFLINQLQKIACIEKIHPSDANFLLVKTKDARTLYEFLIANQVIVRDRSTIALCEGCLRITVGTELENVELIEVLRKYRMAKSDSV